MAKTRVWVSAAFRFMGGYALGGWIQVFYRRVHGMDPSSISLAMILINPLGGLVGSLTGGFLADYWSAVRSFSHLLIVS